MTVVAPTLAELEPISPELVLVAPPDVADRARELLRPFEPWRPAPRTVTRSADGRLSFAAFCGTCGLMTLAPLALIVLAH